ncbi:MAG: T9SS type A sorting domain-containing protein [Rhodothermales bacterium]
MRSEKASLLTFKAIVTVSLMPMWLLLGSLLAFPLGDGHLGRICENESTLDALVECIVDSMPGEASEGFFIPTGDTQNDWTQVVSEMLVGDCEAIVLPESLLGNYTITLFTDAENDLQYCVLKEVADLNEDGVVDKGWGTFIVNRTPRRNIDISVPHPLNDSNTGRQGIGIFKNSGARTFTMAGAHRRANGAMSSCQEAFHVADAAHNVNVFFHRTLEILSAFYNGRGERFNSLQFHGMGTSTCAGVNVYLTHGSRTQIPVDGAPIHSLQANLSARHPSWVVTVPGDTPSCTLAGTTNVQGRLLNNVPPADVCTSSAIDADVTGSFIHIEQKFDNRAQADWFTAINETFPEIQSVGNEQAELPSGRLQEWSVYPNPIGRFSTIEIQFAESEDVSLVLYDALGRLLQEVYAGWMYADHVYQIQLHRNKLPAGQYTLVLKGQDFQESQSVFIIR